MNFDEAFIEKSLQEALRSKQSLVEKVDPSSKHTCSIQGCGRKIVGNGFCNAHYLRSRKGLDLNEPIVKVLKNTQRVCKTCGDDIGGKGGWGLCMRHYKQERTLTIKSELIKIFGGCCSKCKGVFHNCVYDFHHLGDKDRSPSDAINSLSIAKIASEMSKCVLLCANCHREEHHGL